MSDFLPLYEIHITESIADQISIDVVDASAFGFEIQSDANTQFSLDLVDESFSIDLDTELFIVEVGAHVANNIGNNVVASETVDVIVTAAVLLGMYKAVEASGSLCEPTEPSLNRYAGVTKVATAMGQPASLVRAGLVTEAGWTWTANLPIFIGAAGILTQVTASNPVRRIGWAISPTQIQFDPYPTIGA